MIDTHNHLLCRVDDGSQSKESTLAMLNDAKRYGIKKIIATPHCWPGIKYENDETTLIKPYQEACAMIDQFNLDIELYLGSEIFTSERALDWIRNKRALTLNGTNRFLIELPWSIHRGRTIDETATITKILEMGYRVVIAHPERYDCVRQDLDILKKWRAMGCAFQINRTSLTERYVWESEIAWKIMEAGYADIIATDAHHYTGSRIMRLDDVYDLLKDKYNEDVARLLLIENPQALIDGTEIKHL